MNNLKIEKAILVGVKLRKGASTDFASSLEELKSLTEAAGGEVIATLVQVQDRPNAATYIGKGKVEELNHLAAELQPDLVIFDSELTPVQLRNLEQAVDVRVIDRTMLILDIFGQRARSREGLLQVELATLEYRLPRLTGKGAEMSRLGGGIGTRGAGEQKLELDRRRIRSRIRDLKRQMEKLETTRRLHRKRRQRVGVKTVSLVGYTNAGKSSLFNMICQGSHRSGKKQVEAGERLFQTLDTTTRKIVLPSGQEVLITDTVGFIQNLPHHLVAAFRATLEEAVDADLLLHIVDVADANHIDKTRVVERVLVELGADPEKIITVFNKADLIESPPAGEKNVLFVSAHTGMGIEQLLERIAGRLDERKNRMDSAPGEE
ncbi:MAG: GTPase HflX [Syntrophomonadaceae bacterium]|nr:GTPase HflX [Syntrophomonadaceae bacterium]